MGRWRMLVCALLLSSPSLAQTSSGNTSSLSPPDAPPSLEQRLEQLERAQQRNSALESRVRELEQELQALKQPAPLAALPSSATQPPDTSGDPFAWGDFTWLNGSSRQTHRLLDTTYFTPQIDVDVNYTYSFNRPIDDTIVGSTATARHNEVSLAFLGAGGDLHIGNVRGRLLLQYGDRAASVPRLDVSATRGQFNLLTAYQYLAEAYAGYHVDAMHGINLDLGLFFSYVGTFSYTQFENWGYQASFASDDTPWYFNGARIQLFPTDRLKVELWVINGWQSYGKYNELPGLGYQIQWSPHEWVKVVFNGYGGTDTQDHPGRVRLHSDNSAQFRYFNHPQSNGFSRAAFSLTLDVGIEQGDGVTGFGGTGTEGHCTAATPCTQNFISAMAYHNLWFWQNRMSWMVGGGFIHNPGRYLVILPAGVAATTFDTSPGTRFDGFDASTNVSWYPTENLTVRFEFSYRHTTVPYFSGRGGVTGPDGYNCGGATSASGAITSCAPPGWQPDLVDHEAKLILALLFRV